MSPTFTDLINLTNPFMQSRDSYETTRTLLCVLRLLSTKASGWLPILFDATILAQASLMSLNFFTVSYIPHQQLSKQSLKTQTWWFAVPIIISRHLSYKPTTFASNQHSAYSILTWSNHCNISSSAHAGNQDVQHLSDTLATVFCLRAGCAIACLVNGSPLHFPQQAGFTDSTRLDFLSSEIGFDLYTLQFRF